jgi:putative heme iron utilization protein
MDAEASRLLRALLADRPIAALATLHKGEPAVSMVPFVLPAGETQLLVHVSALATHTRDMQEHARVGVLVTGELAEASSPQALPRVSLQCDAAQLPREGAAYEAAKAHYLARFPDSEQMFELGDFSIFTLQPVSARLVAGFGRAYSLVGEALDRWLKEIEPA